MLNKQPGYTSFESLGPVKRAFATGKVCHTGTLDKFARGLLVVLVGPAVKLASWFVSGDKRYRAVFKFGEETDTLDPGGVVTAAAPVPSREALEGVIPRFTGEIEQVPPLYSAVHVNGKRAHELARSLQGKEKAAADREMKKRKVIVHSAALLSWDPPLAELEIHCSKGTYIRSLARDMALAAGSRAHVVSLTRTAVGNFSLAEALDLPAGGADADAGELLRRALKPLSPELFARLDIPSLRIDEKTARAVAHGVNPGALRIPGLTAPGGQAVPAGASPVALFRFNSFAALIERDEKKAWRYGNVNAAC